MHCGIQKYHYSFSYDGKTSSFVFVQNLFVELSSKSEVD